MEYMTNSCNVKLVNKLVKQIEEEVHDANKYIKQAFCIKQEHPKLSQSYYEMAQDEVSHAQTLYNNYMTISAEVKEKEVVHECIIEAWEKKNEDYVDKLAKVKMKISMFK